MENALCVKAPAEIEGYLSEKANQRERLNGIKHRLSRINDRVSGSSQTDCGNKQSERLQPSNYSMQMREDVSEVYELLDLIEGQISHLENFV